MIHNYQYYKHELATGGVVSRTCDAETGTWSDIDFTQCTLSSPQHTFVLLWITLSTGNVAMVNNRKMDIANDVRRREGGREGEGEGEREREREREGGREREREEGSRD